MAAERAPLELELPPGRRTTLLCLASLGAVGLALLLCFLNGGLSEWGGDNVYFLLLAKALASGQGYVDLHIPGTPAHTTYPPLFPLLLAPLVALGAPLVVLKGWVALLSLAGIGVVYLVAARLWGALTALIVAMATLVSSVFLDPGFSTMSDGPYLLVSAIALLVTSRLLAAREVGLGACAAAGLLIAAAILTRLVGMALLPALAAAALVGRSEAALPARLRRSVIVATLAGLVVAGWFLRGLWAPGAPAAVEGVPPAVAADANSPGPEELVAEAAAPLETAGAADAPAPPERSTWEPGYLREFQKRDQPGGPRGISGGGSSLLQRPLLNLQDLWTRLWWMPAPGILRGHGPAPLAAFRAAVLTGAVGLAALAALGLLRRLIARRDVVDFYAAVYLAGILMWIGGGPRLLLPVLPFMLAYVADGTHLLARGLLRLRRERETDAALRRVRAAELAVLVLALAFSFGVTFASPRLRERLEGRFNPWWHAYLEVVGVLGERSRPDDLVVAMPEQVPYYLVGVRTARVKRNQRPAREILADVLASGATYLITTPFQDFRYGGGIERMVQRFPNRFELLAESGQVRLFAVRRRAD